MYTNGTSRVRNLTSGTAMIVTDLHGDWDAYRRYRDRFFELRARGEADYLILTGDLIHSYESKKEDKSLDIVLDILRLKQRLGKYLIYLLGNHELPHLYGIALQKGNIVFTPRFEAAMGKYRPAIMQLFDSLPFYVRTKAGVAISHTGGAVSMLNPKSATKIFQYSHKAVWDECEDMLLSDQRASLRAGTGKLNQRSYDQMARELLAVSGPGDPRYDDLLIGSVVRVAPDFETLWETFFNKNELQYGEEHYAICVKALLDKLSHDFIQQMVLITGHIVCPYNGYSLVAGRQLRVASSTHARPREAARYLLLDVGKPVRRVEALLSGLGSVFD